MCALETTRMCVYFFHLIWSRLFFSLSRKAHSFSICYTADESWNVILLETKGKETCTYFGNPSTTPMGGPQWMHLNAFSGSTEESGERVLRACPLLGKDEFLFFTTRLHFFSLYLVMPRKFWLHSTIPRQFVTIFGRKRNVSFFSSFALSRGTKITVSLRRWSFYRGS